MGIARLICSLLILGAAATLAGCGANSSPAIPGSFIAGAPYESDTYGCRTIYKFRNPYHGDGPNGKLIAVNGVLFGTTDFGGRGRPRDANGTVFSLTPSGEEHVLYSFKGGANGANPNAGLIDVHGVFYGTTRGGGAGCQRNGCGTVFALTSSGKERTIYQFDGGRDGLEPTGSLVWLDGKLYGTTLRGGSSNAWCEAGSTEPGCGTIFSIDTSGNERVLYRFRGERDGAYPTAPLVALGGKLYGTTYMGGAAGTCDHYCGTLFEVTTSGGERVLHRFTGLSDGSEPRGGPIAVDGVLYGTTSSDGPDGGCCGTVFKSTTSGNESVIYHFKQVPDADEPWGTLVLHRGLLYGIAQGGEGCGYWDSGTVFAVSTSGAEQVVHTFSCKGIYDPSPTLALLDHVLYGTADAGKGAFHGIVFALTQ